MHHRARRRQYGDSWEEFIEHLNTIGGRRRAIIVKRESQNAALLMITRLSEDYLDVFNTEDARRRLITAQNRLIEERRMAKDPTAQRRYIDAATAQMMPGLKLHPVHPRERRFNSTEAHKFWKRLSRGQGIRRAIRRDGTLSPQTWIAINSRGPVTNEAELEAFYKLTERLRGGRLRKRSKQRQNPISDARALEVAVAVLNRRG